MALLKWPIVAAALLTLAPAAFGQPAGVKPMDKRVEFDVAATQSQAWEHSPASWAVSGGEHVIEAELKIDDPHYERTSAPSLMLAFANVDMSKIVRVSFAAYEDQPNFTLLAERLAPGKTPVSVGAMATTAPKTDALKLKMIVRGNRTVIVETPDGDFPVALDFDPKRMLLGASGAKGWATFPAIRDLPAPQSLDEVFRFDLAAGKRSLVGSTDVDNALYRGAKRIRAMITVDSVRPAEGPPATITLVVSDAADKDHVMISIRPPEDDGAFEVMTGMTRGGGPNPAPVRTMTGIKRGERVPVWLDFDGKGSVTATMQGYANVQRAGFFPDSLAIGVVGLKGSVAFAEQK